MTMEQMERKRWMCIRMLCYVLTSRCSSPRPSLLLQGKPSPLPAGAHCTTAGEGGAAGLSARGEDCRDECPLASAAKDMVAGWGGAGGGLGWAGGETLSTSLMLDPLWKEEVVLMLDTNGSSFSGGRQLAGAEAVGGGVEDACEKGRQRAHGPSGRGAG